MACARRILARRLPLPPLYPTAASHATSRCQPWRFALQGPINSSIARCSMGQSGRPHPIMAMWYALSIATACTWDTPCGTAGLRSACGSCCASTPPGPEFWSRRIDDAVLLRKTTLDLESETNAFRVVHAKGDGLSGLIIDRFDDVLSVEIFSLGMISASARSWPCCRTAGNEALSSRSRRAGCPARRLFRPTAREPAPASARDCPGTWNSLPNSFRRRPQDGLFLRSAR